MKKLPSIMTAILLASALPASAGTGWDFSDPQRGYKDAIYATVQLAACKSTNASEYHRMRHLRVDGIEAASKVSHRDTDEVIIESAMVANELIDFFTASNDIEGLCAEGRKSEFYETVSLSPNRSDHFYKQAKLLDNAMIDLRIQKQIYQSCTTRPEARQVAFEQLNVLRKEVFEATRLNYRGSLYPRPKHDC